MVHAIQGMTITNELRAGVLDLVDRLRPTTYLVSPGWQQFALDVGMTQLSPSTTQDAGPVLVVGPPAAVLKHATASSAEPAEFGLVTVVAQHARPWQRATAWRDDTSLDLWDKGWSPQTVDRIDVPGLDSTIEFLVARVRRTPTVVDPASD